MSLVLGILIVCGCVLGGFLEGQGQLLSLWQPNELLIIGGAAIGSFIISNPWRVIRNTGGEFLQLLFGFRYRKVLYIDLFLLLFCLGTKIRRHGLLSVESDIEEPNSSALFGQYPRIIREQRVMDFIIDNMRIVVAGHLSSHELEDLLNYEIELLEEELARPSLAVNTIADALPGFGIVAAVLGIVITMQSLGGDPNILGVKVAAALVGTFLGVFLSYGIIGPLSIALDNQARKKIKMYHCIKIYLSAIVAGTAPQIAVEYARRTLYSELRPTFSELEENIRSLRY